MKVVFLDVNRKPGFQITPENDQDIELISMFANHAYNNPQPTDRLHIASSSYSNGKTLSLLIGFQYNNPSGVWRVTVKKPTMYKRIYSFIKRLWA